MKKCSTILAVLVPSYCQPSTALVARYAMMSIVPTLLVAFVASIAIMSSACPSATGGGLGCGTVSRFVCVHCTSTVGSTESTGKLSSRGLFLARAAVRRHISATKSCREAGLGFREVHVEARACDVMAGVGGAVGPAPDVRQVTQSVVSEKRYLYRLD
jgi:hypothetical protein